MGRLTRREMQIGKLMRASGLKAGIKAVRSDRMYLDKAKRLARRADVQANAMLIHCQCESGDCWHCGQLLPVLDLIASVMVQLEQIGNQIERP